MNLRTAIVVSCDVYFWTVAEGLGLDTIARYAHELGLGERTGVGLNDEMAGIVPDRDWYDRHSPDGFRPGHTTNVAVGQGSVSVTVLQMAVLYAAIANGGKLLRPLVVDRLLDADGHALETFGPDVRRTVALDPDNLALVRDALVGATHSAGGTGAGAASRFPKLKVAGKTGTAQVITTSFSPGMERKLVVKKGRSTESHAWFVAYAPYDAPEVVVSVVVEHGGAGGAAAAPVAMKVLDGYFRLDALRGKGDIRFPLPKPDRPMKLNISRDGWTALEPFGFRRSATAMLAIAGPDRAARKAPLAGAVRKAPLAGGTWLW